MNILVCFKVLPEPDRILPRDWEDFSPDQDLSYAGLDFNCFDSSALELGLKLRHQAEAQGETVRLSALTVGQELPRSFGERLYSIGYDRVLQISLAHREFCPETIADILGKVGKDCDLLIMGRESGMAESGMVPYLTAAQLDWPLVSGVEEGIYEGCLILNCRDEQGLWQVRRKLPLVMILGNSPEVLRMATLRQRMQCRGREIQILPPENRETPGAYPRFSVPDRGRQCKLLDPEAPETYEKLRALLRERSRRKEAEGEKLHLPENLVWIGEPEGVEGSISVLKTISQPLILLPDTENGRILASRLSRETGRSCCFGPEILGITEETVTVRRRCCGSNLTMTRALSLPAVLTCPEVSRYGRAVPIGTPGENRDRVLVKPRDTNGLSEAETVLVCGNGMGSRENCDRVRALASRLGASVGLTRPAALNAWGSSEEILGQSGLQIHPHCCLTLGASGAGPFLQGVQNAEIIIAVNRDPNALIFQNADYGICMDVIKFLENLSKEV